MRESLFLLDFKEVISRKINYLLYLQALILTGIYLLPKFKYTLEYKKIFMKNDFWKHMSVDKAKHGMILAMKVILQ